MEDIKASFQSSRQLGLQTKVLMMGTLLHPNYPNYQKKKEKNIHPLTLSYTKTCKKEFEFELARV